MQRNTLTYASLFAAGVCIVCAVVVSSTAVSLKERRDEVEAQFGAIDAVAVDLRTGQEDPEFTVEGYDQKKSLSDPTASRAAPPNAASIQRLPIHAVVYQVRDENGELTMLILPVEGKGLWSTLYGYLALDTDLNTIRGLTFYQHGETAGLGGEVDNPRWKALWQGRKAFDEAGSPVIGVARGVAGSPEEDPHRVDGISGATLTARGVTHLVQFWLGENGFGPYLDHLEEGGA
jgi:Na+-transporting NADH:ubiquinone oxidoreductase subunit C